MENRYGGASDFPLTDRGRKQAMHVGDALRDRGIQAILSSPLKRASETAAIVQGVLGGIPLQVNFDLRERNTYGVMSGLTRAEAQRIFGYLIERSPGYPGKDKTCAPGGEEYPDFIYRVGRAWVEVVNFTRANGYERILVVTHGKFTLGLFTEILGLGDSYNKELGAVKVVSFRPPALTEEISAE